jgi:hypothetical protein
MKPQHPYRLRAYHNPKNADEALVPPGWRMLYADEFPLQHKVPCRLFVRPIYNGGGPPHFDLKPDRTGRIADITYIIPVAL